MSNKGSKRVTYPLVDVLSRSCCRSLYPGSSWLSNCLVHLQRLFDVSLEMCLAESNAKTSGVFDCHACALTLIWHHLHHVSTLRTIADERKHPLDEQHRPKDMRLLSSTSHTAHGPIISTDSHLYRWQDVCKPADLDQGKAQGAPLQ